MRRGFGLAGLVVTSIVLVIVGVIAYNVGWSDGFNTHLPALTTGTDGTAVAPPYYYGGYGPHWGGIFPLFGFLWFVFVLFVIFALIRFAFFGRMMRGWGGGWGHGMGPGQGHGIPSGIEEKMKEWHRQAHGEPPSNPPSGTTPPPPPPDSRSV